MKTQHLVSFVTSILAASAAAGCTSDPTAELPQTCQDIADADPDADDDDYLLYLGGDPAAPWTAYCKDMDRKPVEYLPLVRTGGDYNYSELSVRRGTGPTRNERLRTSYTKLRIDPETLEIDVDDREYADSGSATPQVIGLSPSTQTVTSLPFALAGACVQMTAASEPVEPAGANIDLSGTPFALDDDFCHGGTQPTMVAPALASDDSAVVLSAGTTALGDGTCAWAAPATPACPAAAPFNTTDGVLALEYVRAR